MFPKPGSFLSITFMPIIFPCLSLIFLNLLSPALFIELNNLLASVLPKRSIPSMVKSDRFAFLNSFHLDLPISIAFLCFSGLVCNVPSDFLGCIHSSIVIGLPVASSIGLVSRYFSIVFEKSFIAPFLPVFD